MREITPELLPELEKHCGKKSVGASSPYLISNYEDFVRFVARLAYLNKDQLLFFRGQSNDYLNRADVSTIYPSIYRSDHLTSEEIIRRFEILESAASNLREAFEEEKLDGYKELRTKKYMQYSILQHYEVCRTPLLDLTHSLRVACSFAQLLTNEDYSYVYIIGLPYITHRISYNSEHDLVSIRLLSICPPDALRPYFQEGYLAGTMDITTDYYPDKTILDFNNRLIAKIKIPADDSFWGKGFSKIPEVVLYPENDKVRDLCASLSIEIIEKRQPEKLEEFIEAWIKLEKKLKNIAIDYSNEVRTITSALAVIKKEYNLSNYLFDDLEILRRYRNDIVHGSRRIDYSELSEMINKIEEVHKQLNQILFTSE